MDALILTCGTGGGHNSAAYAVKETLERAGHHAEVMNPYLLRSKKKAEVIDQVYIHMAQRAPHLFGTAYQLGNLYRKLPVRSPVYFFNRKAAECLLAYLKEHHFDIIVTTHLYPAEMITVLRDRQVDLPKSVFIATDYTCIPFTEETECDAYVIPMKSLEQEFVDRGIPEEKIHPFGIPVSERFQTEMTREEAAERLGLDARKRYILVSGGSIGAGAVSRMVSMLLHQYKGASDMKIIVLCGNYEALYEKLDRRYGDRIILMRYTDQMEACLRLCDCYFSKPGGLSSTEAAVVGTPFIQTVPIPGCESRNRKQFEKRGMSLTIGRTRHELTKALDDISDPETREKMIERQHEEINREASKDLCTFLEELVQETI